LAKGGGGWSKFKWVTRRKRMRGQVFFGKEIRQRGKSSGGVYAEKLRETIKILEGIRRKGNAGEGGLFMVKKRSVGKNVESNVQLTVNESRKCTRLVALSKLNEV